MRCAQCETRNPIGNKFCRECGEKLAVPEDVLAAEEAVRAEEERNQERAARLLTDAQEFADQNKVEQAILLAEEAAERWPRSTSAYSLLASLYARAGDRARAIAAMERIVEMNPDSAADRDRLERLRAGDSSAALRPAAASGRAGMAAGAARPGANGGGAALWLPAAAAGMVGALVLGVGLSLAGSRGGAKRAPADAAAAPQTAMAANPTAPGASPAPTITLSGPKAFLPPPAENNGADPFAPASGSANAAAAAARSPAAPTGGATTPAAPIAAALPRPGVKSASAQSERAGFTLPPAPVKLIGVPTGAADTTPAAAPAPANSGFGTGGRIAVGPPADAGNSIAAAAPPPASYPQAAPPQPSPSSNGYIHITMRQARGSDFSDTPPASTMTIPARAPRASAASGSGGDPLSRAQSLQSAGRYREAIGSYQGAITSDPDNAGSAYQGIALSQQRLGNDAAARTAYRQAISAYQSQASSGRDAGAAQRGIASCKAAMEVLGGG